MSRAENIKNKWRKVRQRKGLLRSLWPGTYPNHNYPFQPDGKYSNNNYVNKGWGIKTNVRKDHSNYRRPGGFGEAMKWPPHDRRQLDDMDEQLEEINEG